MKKLMLVVCLLVATVAARAQFEKGTWLINPSVSGLNLSYNTGTDSARFGFEVKGGAFLADNAALLVDLGADWAKGPDTYKLGVGGRYYFDQVGVFVGANVNLSRYTDYADKTRLPYIGTSTKTVLTSACNWALAFTCNLCGRWPVVAD